ncbi:MAG: ABC transporter permease [Desulfatibacillaceae bacterium]
MNGMLTIARKELADHFSGSRFVILLALVAMVSVITTHMAGMHLRSMLAEGKAGGQVFLLLFTTSGGLFSLIQFIALFGPLLGLILGFDAVNRERSQGTLAKILAQPIYRDAVITGKFLAGALVLATSLAAIFLLVTGLSMAVFGLVPSSGEVMRLAVFYIISVFYVALWLAVSILFSILFRGIATSAMAAVAVWIFFTFFAPYAAMVAADAVRPPDRGGMVTREGIMANYRVQRTLSLASPTELYRSATATIVDPWRKTSGDEEFISRAILGPQGSYFLDRFKNPLDFGASLSVVWPYISTLVAVVFVLFGVAYAVFMRQEIRAG